MTLSRFRCATSWLACAVLGLASLAVTPVAHSQATRTLPAATCTSTGAAVISLPNVTLPSTMSKGQLLGTPGTASINFTCSNLPVTSNGKSNGTISTADRTATIQAGQTLATLDSTNVPGGPGITFALAGNPGLALLVTASPTQATSYSDATLGDRSREGPNGVAGYAVTSVTNSGSISSSCSTTNPGACFTGSATAQTYTAQLIVTDPTKVTSGTVSGITLMPFWWYIAGGDQNSSSTQISGATLSLAGGTTISAPSCTVNTDSTNQTVTLPTVSTKQLTSAGTTEGLTPFFINLTCQSGAKVSITLNTATQGTTTGVITNTTGSGYATNIGIQVLYNGTAQSNAVTFGAVQSLGTATSAMSIPYYAQYYVITTPVAAGLVKGTATFTLSYQ
ncbi:fimbrial protein [Dyella sp. C11]|uniref:fimbrial protein n=1 Tax=Dyella sp. C11 TaxID=2126991 RepID=UPI000D645CFC|nr:fimbrial protein [Dyella sp. C11]